MGQTPTRTRSGLIPYCSCLVFPVVNSVLEEKFPGELVEYQLPSLMMVIRFLSSKYFSVLLIALLLSVIWPWFGLGPAASFASVKFAPHAGWWLLWRFSWSTKSSWATQKTFWWHWIQICISSLKRSSFSHFHGRNTQCFSLMAHRRLSAENEWI